MKKPAKRLDRSHVAIESVEPTVDAGRFRAKASVGSAVLVTADVFSHGHESVRAHVRFRPSGTRAWRTVPMAPLGNDRFSASLVPDQIGATEFEVVGEVDHLGDWLHDAARRTEAGAFDPDDPGTGATLLAGAAHQLAAAGLRVESETIGALSVEAAEAVDLDTLGKVLEACAGAGGVLAKVPPAGTGSASARYELLVSAPIAAFSSWYEMFPRSASAEPGRHGTLRDLVTRLDYVAELGFDVLYLPPIHPIGTTARKGRNNARTAVEGDVGSPWAIGSAAGGHTAIAQELGTLEDFDALVSAARAKNIEIALDLALQCSPDHPWVTEHPDWFAHRADGSIACAENPPKRYEDIYPIDFDTPDRQALYEAVLAVVRHWIGHGVRIFRVDNPHTKPFAFWEWLIAEVRGENPSVVFFSEAFTRPKVMHRLAKLGFDQSYTYFTWRDSKHELTEYFEELAHGPGSTYLRPNVWPNTPDILARSLQRGGRPSFVTRLVLAAGLSSNYGIYGPVFELMLDEPARPGTDGDYVDSEKYELRTWDLDDPRSLRGVVSAVNRARHAHPALQQNATLAFHSVDNEQLLCWSKRDAASRDRVLCIVNLDPYWTQSGFVSLDLGALGLEYGATFDLHDLLDDAWYRWTGGRNFVMLDPGRSPAHLFSVRPFPEETHAGSPEDQADTVAQADRAGGTH